jgi:hypothetical protein
VTILVKHDAGCHYARQADGGHSDAAKRVADWYNLHRIALGLDAVGHWIAVLLQDGSSDGVLYDSKIDAATHQSGFEYYYAFIQIRPCQMTVCEAEAFMFMQRTLYKLGNHQADTDHPSGGRQIITRLTNEDQRSMVRALATGGRPSNLLLPGQP